MILVIDNLDSFTYNLVDILLQGKLPVKVVRNDEISVEMVERLSPVGLLISPGPGRPEHAGNTLDVVKYFLGKMPVLGVCLGHQMLGELVGMRLSHAVRPSHGKTSLVHHDGLGVFEGVSNPFPAMRYHSLVLEECSSQDKGLIVSARTPGGDIMAIRHKFLNFEAVQFHPESILTEEGSQLLGNWMRSLESHAVC